MRSKSRHDKKNKNEKTNVFNGAIEFDDSPTKHCLSSSSIAFRYW